MKLSKEQKIQLGLLVTVLVIFYMYYHGTKFENREITIKKDNIFKAHELTKRTSNLVSTDTNEIYRVSSNFLILFFKSSEILSQLEEGQTYMISGYGSRIHWLGLYPQITFAQKPDYM